MLRPESYRRAGPGLPPPLWRGLLVGIRSSGGAKVRWISWTVELKVTQNIIEAPRIFARASVTLQSTARSPSKQTPNRLTATGWKQPQRGSAGQGPKQRTSVHRGRGASEKERSRRGRRRRAATITPHSTPFTLLMTAHICCCYRAGASHRYASNHSWTRWEGKGYSQGNDRYIRRYKSKAKTNTVTKYLNRSVHARPSMFNGLKGYFSSNVQLVIRAGYTLENIYCFYMLKKKTWSTLRIVCQSGDHNLDNLAWFWIIDYMSCQINRNTSNSSEDNVWMRRKACHMVAVFDWLVVCWNNNEKRKTNIV